MGKRKPAVDDAVGSAVALALALPDPEALPVVPMGLDFNGNGVAYFLVAAGAGAAVDDDRDRIAVTAVIVLVLCDGRRSCTARRSRNILIIGAIGQENCASQSETLRSTLSEGSHPIF
jgi:hypothetical protein